MKKFLFIIITLAVNITAARAYDFTSVAPSGQTLYYNIVDDGVQVTYQNSSNPRYTDLNGPLSIPSSVTYNGTTYSVTSIGELAFCACSGLTSVTIPNTVTAIGRAAFSNCTGLCAISVPNSVSTIGSSAFYNIKAVAYTGSATGSPWGAYNATDEIYWDGNIIYDDALKTHLIGCCSCSEGDLTIPSTVVSIGKGAFSGCSGLTSVTIPNSVTSIGQLAFDNCNGLISVTIPNSVTSIGEGAFRACNGLTSVTIPNSVTSISEGAFSGCSGLTSVTIPNSVTDIGLGAFSGCSGLTHVTIPNSVTSIGLLAFQNCNRLTSVTIPNSVISIGQQAFESCSGLTSVTIIPNSVASIGSAAFIDCSGLTSVHLTGDVANWCKVTFINEASNPLYYAHNLYINDTLVTNLIIPNTVDSIRNFTFFGCTSLTGSLTIPNSVTYIGKYAFANCTNLTEIYSLNTTPPSLNITPPQTSSASFTNVPNGIPVHVPCGSISAYQSAWSYFSNLIGIFNSVAASSANPQMGNAEVTMPFSCENLQATVTATANDGYFFDHWSDGSTDNPYQLTVVSDTLLTAYFVHAYTITAISDNDAMGSTSGNGTYPDGSEVTITATANYGYHFIHWNEGNTDNPRTVTISGNATYTAYFAPNQYTISVISNNDSQGNVSGSGSYDYLSEQTISASANYGYHFDHWNDGNTENPRIVAVTEDVTYTAYFSPNQYIITVNSNNSAQGSVSGGGSYDYLSERTITATANYGYHFTHWNDGNTNNPRTITLTQDVSFTAFFDVNQYTFNVYSDDESQGTVSGGGSYNYLDTVTAIATPAAHHHFVRWRDFDGYHYTNNPLRFLITDYFVLFAEFAIDKHTVSVAVDDIAHGSVQASGTTFVYGNPCTVTATAYSGYTFSSWSNGMTDNPYTFAVLNDVDLIAYFVPTGSQPTTYYTITGVSADPSMGSVTGSGTYSAGTITTITAEPYSGYQFIQWQDGNTQRIRTITVTGNAMYTAYFDYSNDIADILDADGVKVYTRGGKIVVEASKDEKIHVYDMIGRTIYNDIFDTPISLPAAGVYMVKVGDGKPHKVVTR